MQDLLDEEGDVRLDLDVDDVVAVDLQLRGGFAARKPCRHVRRVEPRDRGAVVIANNLGEDLLFIVPYISAVMGLKLFLEL